MMDTFDSIFDVLKQIFEPHLAHLQVNPDSATEYTLHTRVPAPFKQHKGQPMCFGAVRRGKAYVSFYLVPLCMDAELTATISPALKKRMQGKPCFNFKSIPDPELLDEMRRLTAAGLTGFQKKGWA